MRLMYWDKKSQFQFFFIKLIVINNEFKKMLVGSWKSQKAKKAKGTATHSTHTHMKLFHWNIITTKVLLAAQKKYESDSSIAQKKDNNKKKL